MKRATAGVPPELVSISAAWKQGQFDSGDILMARWKGKKRKGQYSPPEVMASILSQTGKGGKYAHLHPGNVTLYRGHRKGKPGVKGPRSFSTSLAVARRFGKHIAKVKVTRDIPALALDRALASIGHGYQRESEVVVFGSLMKKKKATQTRSKKKLAGAAKALLAKRRRR